MIGNNPTPGQGDQKGNDSKTNADWRTEVKAPPKDMRLKTADVTATKGHDFEDFIKRKELMMGLVEKGFEKPSPVQEECIPVILDGKSVIARAKNGTGKTGAFVIPILEKIDTSRNTIQALILVPTRELALQISSIVKDLGKYLKVESMVSTGGSSVREDIIRLHNPVHVLVGTPGRILDLAYKKVMSLNECNIVCLDEADKLLSVDFQPVIEKLLRVLPKTRQILLFSATFPQIVKSFKETWMPEAVIVNLMEELTLIGVTQYYVFLEEKQKIHCLNTLFSKLNINQAIIFCNSTLRVELLAKKIIEASYSCYYIHAKMSQWDRNKVFHNFRSGNGRCLVSSDLCTRGIDIQSVNVVINFDFPKTSETYLHRIGRSGRFGHLGLAINFITQDDVENFMRIEKELDTEIQPMPKEVDKSLY